LSFQKLLLKAVLSSDKVCCSLVFQSNFLWFSCPSKPNVRRKLNIIISKPYCWCDAEMVGSNTQTINVLEFLKLVWQQW